MLIGEYQHSIDLKGRLSIPSKFREDLGETFIISKGLDGCLFLFPLEEWEKFKDKVLQMPFAKSRDMQRYFFSSAHDVQMDKLGRILIASHLREFADLLKDVVVNGISSRAEIWDRDKWLKQNESLTSDKIAETMESIGF